MISLEEYKNYLIDTYHWEYDNNDKMKQERKERLSKKYSDEFLQKIVKDTQKFVADIFNSETINYGYCRFELYQDTTSYISLGLSGGWFSDRLFTDIKGRIISEYILHNIFGKQFMIYVKDEEIIIDTDNDLIVGVDYTYSLYMQGFPQNINEIKEEFLDKTKQLIKRVN